MIKRFIVYIISLFLFIASMQIDAAWSCCFPCLRPQNQVIRPSIRGVPSLTVRHAARAVHPSDFDPHPTKLFPAEREQLKGLASLELSKVESQRRELEDKIEDKIKESRKELDIIIYQQGNVDDMAVKPKLENYLKLLTQKQNFTFPHEYNKNGYADDLNMTRQALNVIEKGDALPFNLSIASARVRAQNSRGSRSSSQSSVQLDVPPVNSSANFPVLSSLPSPVTTPVAPSQRENRLRFNKRTPRASLKPNEQPSSPRQQPGERIVFVTI
jgi:hypothetical protein